MNIKYEVWTEFGWCDFDGIRKVDDKPKVKLSFDNCKTITVTPDHLFYNDFEVIECSKIKVGDSVDSENGKLNVKDIEPLNEVSPMFDFINVSNSKKSYYTNSINSHNCSFTGSSYTLIDGEVLQSIQTIDPPFYPEEGFYMWKKPVHGRLYLVACDVAKGANTDYHVANVFDATDWHTKGIYEQVALFRRNDISVFEFKDKVIEICKKFNNAVVIIENNHLGHTVVHNIYYEDGYDNTWYDYDKGEYGVNATVKTKPLALSYFKDDIEKKKMIIISMIFIIIFYYFGDLGGEEQETETTSYNFLKAHDRVKRRQKEKSEKLTKYFHFYLNFS